MRGLTKKMESRGRAGREKVRYWLGPKSSSYPPRQELNPAFSRRKCEKKTLNKGKKKEEKKNVDHWAHQKNQPAGEERIKECQIHLELGEGREENGGPKISKTNVTTQTTKSKKKI